MIIYQKTVISCNWIIIQRRKICLFMQIRVFFFYIPVMSTVGMVFLVE